MQIVSLTSTQESLWWVTLGLALIVLIAVAAFLTLLVSLVSTIEKRVDAIRATLDHGQPVVSAAEQALHDSFTAMQGRFLADHSAPIESVVFGSNGT